MNSKLFVLVVFLFTFAVCMPAADDKVIESMYLPKLLLYRFGLVWPRFSYYLTTPTSNGPSIYTIAFALR